MHGIRANLPWMVCAICGMFTATFGGLTRDVLIRKPPRILHSYLEIYATPALAGGLATTAWLRVAPHRHTEAVLCGTYMTVLARILAVNHNIKMPTMGGNARS